MTLSNHERLRLFAKYNKAPDRISVRTNAVILIYGEEMVNVCPWTWSVKYPKAGAAEVATSCGAVRLAQEATEREKPLRGVYASGASFGDALAAFRKSFSAPTASSADLGTQ